MATDTNAMILHNVPYANHLYNNPGYNFSRSKHSLASAYWDRAALAAGKGASLVKSMQVYLDRGNK